MAFDRRSLLISSSLSGAGLVVGCQEKPAPVDNKPAPKTDLKASAKRADQRIQTLVAVADRILPPEPEKTGPVSKGAKALGAEAYFVGILADKRMAHLRRPLDRGVSFLNRGAKLESKAEGFWALTAAQQDSWLERLNENKVRPNGIKGSQFMRLMVALTLEACLGAPKHGGNNGEATWKWLNYSEHGRGGVPT